MKFHLETFGCKFNKADSALIERILKEKGFKKASEREADFFILNSCGVVEKTERKIMKRALELKKKKKKVILTGCLPLISPKVCRKIANGIVGTANILSLPIVLKRVFEGKKSFFLKEKEIDKAKLKCFLLQENSCIAILPISEGCLSFCSYCATKLARKNLRSFERKEILKNIELALKSGSKEIQLTAQDLAIYGLDKGEFLLPKLLKEISKIRRDFRIRLGMMSPQFAKKIFNKILKILENEKFYKFLHLPLQSGSNRILRLMKRNYRVEDFLKLVKSFKKKFKNSLLATDIIVGFPSETEKDFKKAVKIIKEIKPDILHLFKYSKREGTEASKMKDFPDRVKKERTRALTKIWLELSQEKNKKFVGKKFEALITEKRRNSFLARLSSYKAVILNEGKIGQFKKVKIIDFKPNYLLGKTD